MQLVAGTFCYENVVMHIMRMVFHSNVESYKLMYSMYAMYISILDCAMTFELYQSFDSRYI